MAEAKLLCYNRGCGQSYTEESNQSNSCRYHPGAPVFHEGYKGWSCCSKKTTDFTEFLNIKGCEVGHHSNVKPVVEEVTNKINEVTITKQEDPKPVYVPMERPTFNSPLVPLKWTIGNSLKPVLEKLKTTGTGQNENSNEVNSETEEIKIGTACKNAACKKTYTGPTTYEEKCIYHTGVPVFHEGLKYWTCCQRRTTDFESFLAQEGCEVGQHKWVKAKSTNECVDKSKTCRYDWHQTGEHIVISIYSKSPLPHESLIEANQVRLKVSLIFGGNERNEFELDAHLYGIIDIEKSSVNYLATKVEITMKKAEPIYWKFVQIPE